MTRPEISFALFTNGSPFSLQVCDCLAARQLQPDLIALPQYPPARVATQAGIRIETAATQLHRCFAGVERVYAPRRDTGAIIDRLGIRPVDYILVACWPYLIPADVHGLAGKAAVNLHPSMLPAYRGPDPLTMQIAAMETEFGVSLHLLNSQFDRGELLGQTGFRMDAELVNRYRLEKRCAELGVDLFLAATQCTTTDR